MSNNRHFYQIKFQKKGIGFRFQKKATDRNQCLIIFEIEKSILA